MLIIPELETIVLQPPRTGSTSIRDAVLATYPSAFTPYRHMERDGIPFGYTSWAVVGVIRHPFDRLASLHRYMRHLSADARPACPIWRARISRDVNRSFEDWLLSSEEVFTDPVNGAGKYIPRYTVRHPMPITRKGLHWWLRPDLGEIEILRIEQPDAIEERLGLRLERRNASHPGEPAVLTKAVEDHLRQYHDWDCRLYGA